MRRHGLRLVDVDRFPALHGGTLRWTVARLLHTRHPGLLLAGSLLVRLALLAAGLLVVLGGSWPRALACLAGVLLARTLLVRKEARSCG